GTNQDRRTLRDKLGMRDPEEAIEKFATDAYKAKMSTERDNARNLLRNVAPPLNAPAPAPNHGVTGQMNAKQGAQHILANSAGRARGYDHRDQPSKDLVTELIKQSGQRGGVKHVFAEEFSTELQNDINPSLPAPAGEMSKALRERIQGLK